MTLHLIAADIGGTSSRFAHFEVEEGKEPVKREGVWLETKKAASFPELLEQLAQSGFPLSPAIASAVVIAVAGPIREGVTCKPPNISWEIDLRNAGQQWGMKKFFLINDFLAQAFAACSPIGKGSRQVLSGTVDPNGTVAVIGAGTGLGKALLVPDRGGYIGVPSEGGHTNFCPESAREMEFFQFVKERVGSYAIWDEIVSGRGLSTIHEFLSGVRLEPKDVSATALGDGSETLAWAARFYGRVCRNFVLETLATGGMYIAGGVAAKNPVLLTNQAFEQSFRESRAHAALLQAVPVFLMDNEESGLCGAAYYAWNRLR